MVTGSCSALINHPTSFPPSTSFQNSSSIWKGELLAGSLVAASRVREISVTMLHLRIFTLLLTTLLSAAQFEAPNPWTWRCVPQEGKDALCVKEKALASTTGTESLAACQLTCGKYGALWPEPQNASIGSKVVYFLPENIFENIVAEESDAALISEALKIFKDNLNAYNPDYKNGTVSWPQPGSETSNKLQITIEIEGPSQSYLTLDNTDEHYSLYVEYLPSTATIIAQIRGKTFFGARHGLETLSQLIDFEEDQNSLMIVDIADISDQPFFAYRGLLVDTSRNFISIDAIKRTIDGMAASKLNTFHWHITDSHSFPMVLQSLPKMAYYGAYSARQQYQPEDIRQLVDYGQVRGVRVLPEFDAPAHVGAGWEWGPQEGLGDLAVCVNREPWLEYCVEPPCGQLNIANENIYPVLGKIYTEMLEMFGPVDLFHFGGDEVNLNCWNTTQEIVDYMTANNLGVEEDSYYSQWSAFQDRAYDLLTEANNNVQIPGIVWTSHLTEKGHTDLYLDRNKYIIQIWSTGTDPLIKELLEKNFRVIFSNYDAWYLDCGFGAWVGEGNNWCTPYKGWQVVYDNSPTQIALNLTQAADLSLILGGEAALWTEQVDSESVDGRLWPRGAALAERLWTNPDHGWRDAEYRMIHHRQRLVKRGVRADRLQPEWCHQNQGLCYLN
ncbi:Beta-hexosaminidase eukaryotic type N-terminal [Trinorchestia longiramus]|nr:Beta-hexosaminidase eukaryotic type N-terminal [Trinorchestia longiramus]